MLEELQGSGVAGGERARTCVHMGGGGVTESPMVAIRTPNVILSMRESW